MVYLRSWSLRLSKSQSVKSITLLIDSGISSRGASSEIKLRYISFWARSTHSIRTRRIFSKLYSVTLMGA